MRSFQVLAVLAVAALPSGCRAHWRLTKPVPRAGAGVYENDPLPPDANTEEQWVCRHAQPNPAVQRPTIVAGDVTDIVYGTYPVGHVGDCAVYLSCDLDRSRRAMRWVKIANLPDCRSQINQNVPIAMPGELPAGNAVLRWDQYALHQGTFIEWFVQCADVAISSSSTRSWETFNTFGIIDNNGTPAYPSSLSRYRSPYRQGEQAPEEPGFWMTGPACVDDSLNQCALTAVGTKGYTGFGGEDRLAGSSLPFAGTPEPAPALVPAPPPAYPAAPTPAASFCCADFVDWPSVDNGVTCSGCTALVLTAPYGNRCDAYCESFGHVCVRAAEEISETCQVDYAAASCSTPISGTSDMLCSCQLPTCAVEEPGTEPTSVPTPAPTPAPAASTTPEHLPTPAPKQAPTVAAPGPAPPPPAAAGDAECCYDAGCAAYGTSLCSGAGTWCSESEEACWTCGGSLCADPAGATQAPPSPAAASSPPEAAEGGQCCYAGGCASYGTPFCNPAGSWCSGSAEACSGCGGTLCSGTASLMSTGGRAGTSKFLRGPSALGVHAPVQLGVDF